MVRLSDELWSGIFAVLPRADELLTTDWRQIKPTPSTQQLLQLRLVCKQFNDLHAQQVHRLSLDQHFSSNALAGLLAWLRRRKPPISSLELNCGAPVLDTVLGAVAVLQTAITHVHIARFSHTSFKLLSAFDSLQICKLAPASGSDVDLSALQGLSDLSRLWLLEGSFTKLSALRSLSHLLLKKAQVTSDQDCGFVSKLKQLDLVHSDMQGFHQLGLSACSQLKSLRLSRSTLEDKHGNGQLDLDLDVVPENLSSLSKLTHLQLGGTPVQIHEQDWLTDLTALKELTVKLAASGPGSLHPLLSLTQLTNIALRGAASGTEVVLDIAWHLLPALQQLSFSKFVVQIDKYSAASLLQLARLRDIAFTDVNTADPQSCLCFTAVLHRLVALNPQLNLTLNGSKFPSDLLNFDVA